MSSLLLTLAITLAAHEVEIQPVAGPKVHGELLTLSAEAVVVETGDGKRTFTPQEIQSVECPDAEAQTGLGKMWLELIDGSRLHAKTFAVVNRVAAVGLPGGGRVDIPTRAIRSVEFRLPGTGTPLADQWRQILETKWSGDVAVIRRSEEALDQLEGVLHDVTDAAVEFEFKNRRLNAPREKLQGLVYYHPLDRKLPSAASRLTDVFGNQWAVKSVSLVDNKLEIATVSGVTAVLPLAELRKLDFSAGNIVYLSDLAPDAVTRKSYAESRDSKLAELPLLKSLDAKLGKMFLPRRDKTFDQSPLLLYPNGGPGTPGEKPVVVKGLAIHGGTTVVYRLPDDFKRFQMIADMDHRTGTGGTVKLVVLGDGKELFAKTIAGIDPPLPIDLDIAGVGRLAIIVEYGEELDVPDQLAIADHLFLYKARISK